MRCNDPKGCPRESHGDCRTTGVCVAEVRPPAEKILYDPACEDLARHFLLDSRVLTTSRAPELANHIQKTVESWLAFEEMQAERVAHDR